jgi:hypothetical protein
MLDHVFRRPSVRDRIRANLLGEWLPDYISYLVARGHAPHLIQEYARSVEHFGSWLASEHLAPEAITRATIRSFLRDHLPACRCPGPAPTTFRHVRAALNHLLRLPGGPTQRARPASVPGRCGARSLSQPPPRYVRLDRGDVLLSTPTRPRVPRRQVRRRSDRLGGPAPRGPDLLRRRIRCPLSTRYSPGGGQLLAQPPPVPPAPRLLRPERWTER